MTSFSAVTITLDQDIADAVVADIKTASRKYRKLYRTRIEALQQKTLRILQMPAPAVKRPLIWASRRQQNAFFKSKGFGKGIPTKRTGALQAGWHGILEDDFTEGLFTLYNDATTRDYFTGAIIFYEQYVTGINMQPFHKNTGYVPSQNILANAMIEAEEIVIQSWWESNGAK